MSGAGEGDPPPPGSLPDDLAALDDWPVTLSTPIPSGGTPGPRLTADLAALDNNVYGQLHGFSDAGLEALAHSFVRLGWRARRSSWDEFETECAWCSINMFESGGVVTFAGVVDPGRVAELAAAIGSLGYGYEIELYDQAGEMTRTLRPS